MTNIFILLLPLLLISSCTLPLFQEPGPDLPQYQNSKPLCSNRYFTIHHLAQEKFCEEILGQGTDVWQTLQHWLDIPPPFSPVPVLIFSDTDPIGKYFLKKSQTRHRSTGHYDPAKNVLFLIGHPGDPRFMTVLRHEAAHATLHNAFPDGKRLPFWADEGIASLMEELPGDNNNPPGNIERLTLVHYIQDRDGDLNFTGLIKNPSKRIRSGMVYARSWALASCLYRDKRPIGSFLSQSDQTGHSTPKEIFGETLLRDDESFANFENGCYKWLHSFKNTGN